MNKVDARLSCRHMVKIDINQQDNPQAYCRFHGWQNITRVHPQAVHMFCADCRISRWYGQAMSRGISAAERHRENNPHHRTFVVWDDVTRDGKGIQRETVLRELATQAKLWDDGDTPETGDNDVIPF